LDKEKYEEGCAHGKDEGVAPLRIGIKAHEEGRMHVVEETHVWKREETCTHVEYAWGSAPK